MEMDLVKEAVKPKHFYPVLFYISPSIFLIQGMVFLHLEIMLS